MKLYLAEPNELHVFELPTKIEGSFLFDFHIKGQTIKNSLSIDAQNNQWVLKSNGNVDIYTSQSLKAVSLQVNDVISLKAVGCDKLLYLYVLPILDHETILLKTMTDQPITFGSAPMNCLYYQSPMVLSTQLNCIFQNNAWYIVPNPDPQAMVYHNRQRITQPTTLHIGDIIFSAGIKIIWMQQFVKTNNPKHLLTVKNLTTFQPPLIDNTHYTEVTEEQANVELYTEDSYFFHTPRLRTVISKEQIVIDAPPGNQEDTNELPLILSIGSSLTMLAFSAVMMYNVIYGLSTGIRDFASVLPSIIICVAMVIGSVIIPILIRRYQKKVRHQRELLRQKKYTKYVEDKEKQIQSIIKQHTQILNENYVSLEECQNIIMTKKRNIWSREIEDDDFLTVRVGLGSASTDLTIQVPEEHFTLDDDNLREMIYQLPDRYKTLEHVPITVSLLDNLITAFICNSSFSIDYINGIILQLITFHSALDLKLVLLTTSENESRWSYVKKLPHCWNDDKSARFFATNLQEIKSITSYLEKEYRKRQEIVDSHGNNSGIEEFNANDVYKNFQPYYLIITDDYSEIKDIEFIKNYLERTNNVGFSLMMIEKSMKNLPNECNLFIQILETSSGVFRKELSGDNQKQFQAEYNPLINMVEMADILVNIPIQSKEQESTLPTSLTFLDVYNVGKVEQLNVLNRWQTSNPVNSLACPIGVHSNGDPFILDLHEKVAGPHGLIAGSTGSGKSELIITYILSMAINYRPEEVQFVLIDYKGGGLAGAFENRELNISLPHLVGTITNLDTSEMNRTLVSIESELKRRQEKFNRAKEISGESTMDIYKYQRLYREGVIQEPVSHLFVISDEFAELKAQQPDFMAQLITTARIGRSLGVHLILATQKPSGVVNDQIWSNSRFRICLKVQTRADSNEMLKRPEAASLKEAGRFYLQVGYDEYFDIGQAGWAGARYIPTERLVKKMDNSLNFIDNIGSVFRSVNDTAKRSEQDYGDQLTNIVKYLVQLGQKERRVSPKLWLPTLSDKIYLGNLRKKYDYQCQPYYINPLIGEYDAPMEQIQGPCILDITTKGNTLIYGQTGSGKENLLTTILFSIVVDHSPDEVNIYIADFGAETLKAFHKAPQVGDVFLLDEEDKMNNLLIMLQKELDIRKKLFADYAGNYQDYIKNSKESIPYIIVIINGYEMLLETYPQYTEAFLPLFRDASKYGISFIVTATAVNSVRIRVSQYFANKICLQLPNNYDYKEALGAPKNLIPANKFGRGILLQEGNTYEFQTAFINERPLINQTIKDTVQQLGEVYTKKAKKIPILPKIVGLDDVLFELKDLANVPIGIEKNSLEVYVYDFTKEAINLIAATYLEKHIYFFYALVQELSMLAGVRVEVIDILGIFKQKYQNIKVIQRDFDAYITSLAQYLNTNQQEVVVYIFLGVSQLEEQLDASNKQLFEQIMLHANELHNSIFVIADLYEGIKKIQGVTWYKTNVDNSFGIWLGADVATQLALNIVSLSLEDKKIMFPCISYPVYKGHHMIVKYVVDGVGDQNES